MTPELLTLEIPGNEQLGVAPYRLACWQWGDAYAPEAVVCVHGLTRNGRDFDFLAEALAGNRRVLCPDMPGRGQSDWLPNPAGYIYPVYVATMLFLLSALKVARAHWVGTSMGGIIGMMMAGTAPGVIRSMVLNDVGCLVPAKGLKRILSYAGVKTQFASRAEAEAALRENCKPFGIRDERHWQHLFAHSIEDLPGGGARFAYDPNIVAPVKGIDVEIQDINLWGLWPPVTAVPALLIRGAESDILPRDVALAMQAQHPRLTLREIPGAGHAPALMESTQTEMIAEWLKTVS